MAIDFRHPFPTQPFAASEDDEMSELIALSLFIFSASFSLSFGSSFSLQLEQRPLVRVAGERQQQATTVLRKSNSFAAPNELSLGLIIGFVLGRA